MVDYAGPLWPQVNIPHSPILSSQHVHIIIQYIPCIQFKGECIAFAWRLKGIFHRPTPVDFHEMCLLLGPLQSSRNFQALVTSKERRLCRPVPGKPTSCCIGVCALVGRWALIWLFHL